MSKDRNEHRDDQYVAAFGNNLRKIRKSKGLTQQDLAHEADVWLSTIGRIERGEIDPRLSTVKIVANALNVPPATLLDFEFPEI